MQIVRLVLSELEKTMNRHTKLFLPLFLLATACEQPSSGEDAIRRALPTADQLAVELPTQEGTPVALGAIAETYVWTRMTTQGLNGLTAIILGTVHAVVELPPTSVSGNTYVWGPGSDALDPAEWRLTVVALDEQTYDWQLHGRPKGETGEFTLVLDGHAVAGNIDSGTFHFDLDALHELDPIANPDAQGQADFAYDIEPGNFSMVEVSLENADADAHYRYDEAEDGSGSFQFSFATDIDNNDSALEQAEIRSRWMASGAGRADVRATGGDLAENSVEFSQCWSTAFKSVYEDFDLSTGQSATAGDASACAFAELSLPDQI